eukprot:1507036-Heterocapsa_arctica.AAC.1
MDSRHKPSGNSVSREQNSPPIAPMLSHSHFTLLFTTQLTIHLKTAKHVKDSRPGNYWLACPVETVEKVRSPPSRTAKRRTCWTWPRRYRTQPGKLSTSCADWVVFV